ncbi:hypothetical protein MBAV_004395 [Candidatus Magnetobacterium bavaricum]|uniref:Uncharacterized protein n=1 Tax=Candidatus Magnetobacterium bavaricum TaxID=29290 RepID=A0A0F3GNM7_9BACT|nr:hypothetical protein MBAV_004395 [Candidatus Magnetobacterium bavaricum]
MCSLITTGRLRPTLSVRPARGSSACSLATSTPALSPTTTTYGRCVADNLGHLVIRLFGRLDKSRPMPLVTMVR